MTNKSLQLTAPLLKYLLEIDPAESPAQRRLRKETARLPMARMQIAPEQGHFMALLARLINARRVLEIGVFTGYSSLAVAQALPEDGELVGCDVSEEWTAIARRYWREAGVEHKITLHLAPALQTLDRLLADGEAGRFDLAFIDADKTSYDAYYEGCLRVVRPGGLVLIDNVLQGGRVVEPGAESDNVRAIQALNDKIASDERVDIVLLPLADGLTMARRR